jgi:hypothetical protein
LPLFPQQQQLTRFQQRQQHTSKCQISVTTTTAIRKFSKRNSTSNFSNSRAWYQILTTATSHQVSTSVRRGSVWCGVAQLWCGVAQLVARRLAGRQARVRFSARHHREVCPTELSSNEEMERGLGECMYECDCMIVCMLQNMKNKQKEWHTATKPLKFQHQRQRTKVYQQQQLIKLWNGFYYWQTKFQQQQTKVYEDQQQLKFGMQPQQLTRFVHLEQKFQI